MATITKKLLRQIYAIHNDVALIEATFNNDRNPERARDVQQLARRATAKLQEIINSQDPL